MSHTSYHTSPAPPTSHTSPANHPYVLYVLSFPPYSSTFLVPRQSG
ncbi:hypothetical protein J3R75_003246 [Oligosphaera ethanolica]|uniref:Uncharacterized protein n=1 Tax=Oligosphaera ethanolica TaxID=760260 RepID=A0AAE3VJ96_9BACT|nr:hypothetical protein [Oligosphaera ethanolica]